MGHDMLHTLEAIRLSHCIPGSCRPSFCSLVYICISIYVAVV